MSTPKKTPARANKKEAKGKRVATKKVAPKRDKAQQWALFAAEYVKDFNGARAARAAGYSAKSAAVQASRLITNANVRELLKAASQRIFERAEVDGAGVVRYLSDVLTADPRELVDVVVASCRYCHGVAHEYQFTRGEFARAREKWLDEGRAIEKFDEKGGVGYDPRKPPADDCPECFGDGVARTVVKDTRYLSPKGVRLLAGVKLSKDGLTPVLADQMAAAEKLMRHHGQYLADNKQLGGGGLPGVLEVVFVDPPEREHDPVRDGHAPA